MLGPVVKSIIPEESLMLPFLGGTNTYQALDMRAGRFWRVPCTPKCFGCFVSSSHQYHVRLMMSPDHTWQIREGGIEGEGSVTLKSWVTVCQTGICVFHIWGKHLPFREASRWKFKIPLSEWFNKFSVEYQVRPMPYMSCFLSLFLG